MKSTLFKCLLVNVVVGIPTIYGPFGILMTVLIGRAIFEMFPGNIYIQFLGIMAVILTFIIPLILGTFVLYFLISLFKKIFTSDKLPRKDMIKHDDYIETYYKVIKE